MKKICLMDLVLAQKIKSINEKPSYYQQKTLYKFDCSWDISTSNIHLHNYSMYYEDEVLYFRKNGDSISLLESEISAIFKFDKPYEEFKLIPGGTIKGSFDYAIVLKNKLQLFLTRKEQNHALPEISY